MNRSTEASNQKCHKVVRITFATMFFLGSLVQSPQAARNVAKIGKPL